MGNVGEYDERVVRDGWTFYVQATRRPINLGRTALSTGGLGALVIGVPVELFLDWRARNRTWSIGVVRMGNISAWKEQKATVVHRETLGPGLMPAPRIAELVAQIESDEPPPWAL